MTRREWMGIAALVCVIVVFVISEVVRPRAIDWTETYDPSGEQPNDLSVFVKAIERKGGTVQEVSKTFYEERNRMDPTSTDCWTVITSRFDPDEESKRALVSYLQRGGRALVVASSIPPSFFKAIDVNWSAWEDTSQVTTLLSDSMSASVLVGITVGAGRLIVGRDPELFTNYRLLTDTANVVAWRAIDSVMPSTLILATAYRPQRAGSMDTMSLFMANANLRWAYWVIAATLVLIVVLNGKRRQRPIPIAVPNANASVEFAYLLGDLYFNTKDNHDLVQKLERIFTDHCASTRGLDATAVQALRSQFTTLLNAASVSDQDLIRLHHDCTTFFGTTS